MKDRIVLLGPPASGKGTQAALLSATFGIPHGSTGEMLRVEKAKGSDVGREADEFTRDGKLFSDELAMKVVTKWLDGKTRFILDGFPRTIGQARSFDEEMKRRGMPLDVVYLFDLPDAIIRDRITTRLTCSSCGSVFNESFHKVTLQSPCPKCGAPLMRRNDDTHEALDERLVQYRELTLPVADYYRDQGILSELDVTAGREAVYKTLYSDLLSGGAA
jgi:adenylate kinase